MRLLLRSLAVLAVLTIVLSIGGYFYFVSAYPNVPPAREVTLPSDPESLARGKYLAENVALCTDCHATRDWTKFAGPVDPAKRGQGGERFDRETAGLPGSIHAPNITPFGIGAYTDGELVRAVTTGVARDGRALFPIMPYLNYGRLDESDVHAMLAYVRSLAPIERSVPSRSLDVPLNLIVRTIPQPAAFAPRPLADDRVAYGKYLVTAAACVDCHTPIEQGQRVPDMDFAGGMEFGHPTLGYRVRSANITPDATSGIGQWTEQQFVDKFKAFETPDPRPLTDAEQRQQTSMPWSRYGGMTREDIGAIYAYLRTVKPVLHRVDKWPDARP